MLPLLACCARVGLLMVLSDIGLAPVMSPGLFLIGPRNARAAISHYALAISRLLVLACKILAWRSCALNGFFIMEVTPAFLA
jgi:hypothetical protein